jgi:hypothetical protein
VAGYKINLQKSSKTHQQQMLVRMWGKRNSNPLLVGMQVSTTTLEKNLEAS